MKRAAALLALLPQVAHAEDRVDPAAERAAEANLESQARRRGIRVQFAVGGAMTFGRGYDETIEQGVGTSLRLGSVATERLVFTIEASNFTLLHRPAAMDGASKTHKNLVNNVLVGAQYYVNPALWVRGAVGANSYIGERVVRGDGTVGDLRTAGVAAGFGLGLDVLRLRRNVLLGFEVLSTLGFSREGQISSSSFMLDVSID
ncbi:MAG: hypothetical protein KIT31_10525 [Deltaproteobacteria bacterium]|nr:hypothetical protein [Deltaproteobacteria bacterium]